MEDEVTVYGKDSCPYAVKACEVYGRRNVDFTYFDVSKDHAALGEMLALTGGDRRVPVIVQGKEVKIGFGGT